MTAFGYDDGNKSATAAIWRDVRKMLDKEYPQAALVSEWSNPWQAILGGRFHMDFYLDHWYNGYNTLLRDYEGNEEDNSFFKSDSKGDINRFLEDYMPKYEASRAQGYISMFTCNHDTPRPAKTLTEEELKLAYAFILTMPGVPFIYYGDEIGMRYLDVHTKEGGYQRTGSRTPMQWDKGPNAGFSGCPPENLYLPVDTSPNAPDVMTQQEKEDSLWQTVRDLTHIRNQYPDLQADGLFVPLNQSGHYLFYQRGNMLLGVNPSGEEVTWIFPDKITPVYSIGGFKLENGNIKLGARSFVLIYNEN